MFTRWIEINLDAIIHNFHQVKGIIAPGVKVLAVVKSDAYGHGVGEIARVLEEAGVDMLGVTTVDEGIELRRLGITTPILVMAPLLTGQVADILDHSLTPAVDHLEALEALDQEANKRGIKTAFHLEIETGMGRTGILPHELSHFCTRLTELPHTVLSGVFSHLATAMLTGKDEAKKQINLFSNAISVINQHGHSAGLRHIANSAAVLDLPDSHFDLVRVGTLLFGQYPSDHVTKRLSLQDPWRVKARIISIKRVGPGTGIGYGRDFVAKKEMEIATIPIGYADGFGLFPRTRPAKVKDFFRDTMKGLANVAGLIPVNSVKIGNRQIPVVGRIGMQLSMIDVTGQGAKIGDEVTVSMRRTTANPRIPRVYYQKSVIRTIRGPQEKE